MMRALHGIDLHGFVDGQLSPEAQARVANYLKAAPDDAALVQEWRRQNESIRAMFGQSALDLVPAWLSFNHIAAGQAKPLLLDGTKPAERRARAPVDIAAVCKTASMLVVAAMVGFGAGRLVPALSGNPTSYESASRNIDARRQFTERARDAHATFGLDADRPVEIVDAPPGTLARWFAHHVSFEVRIPDLQRMGWTLRGGRVAPGNVGRAALVIYEDAVGERLSLYEGSLGEHGASGFGNETGADDVLAWVDGDIGYAVVTSKARDWVQRNASALRDAVRDAGPQ